MLTPLNPSIPMIVTSKDSRSGQAIAVIDYGPEHNLIWVVALDDTGEIWCVPGPEVRMQNNWTMKRRPTMEDSSGLLYGADKPRTGTEINAQIEKWLEDARKEPAGPIKAEPRPIARPHPIAREFSVLADTIGRLYRWKRSRLTDPPPSTGAYFAITTHYDDVKKPGYSIGSAWYDADKGTWNTADVDWWAPMFPLPLDPAMQIFFPEKE